MPATVIKFPTRRTTSDLLFQTRAIRKVLQGRFPGLTWGEPELDDETQYIVGHMPGAMEPSVSVAFERLRTKGRWVAFGPILDSRASDSPEGLADALNPEVPAAR